MRYNVYAATVFGAALITAVGSPTGHVSLAGAQISPTYSNQQFMSLVTATVQPKKPAAATKNVTKVEAKLSPAPTVHIENGDTLQAVAKAHGLTYQRLYDANTSLTNPDLIYPGQDLSLPNANDVIAVREIPTGNGGSAPTATSVLQFGAYQSVPSAVAASQPEAAPAAAEDSIWDSIAACEAGGNWAINTGNGYYGGLQFTLASWQAVGGTGMPNQASRDEQILRGQILQSRGGWGNWPACTAKLGIR